jgi:hypothetical protein
VKKLLILAALLIAATGAGLAWSLSTPATAGVSKVKANPGKYVGTLKMTGLAGGADPQRGLLEITDERSCCSLVVEVPLTALQQQDLRSAHRYAGEVPARGTPLEVLGNLRPVEGSYAFEVVRITSSGAVLIRRI